jgi:hypothetical protein
MAKRNRRLTGAQRRPPRLGRSSQLLLDSLVDAANAALRVNPDEKPAPQDIPANRFKIAVYREVRQLIIDGRQKTIVALVSYGEDERKLINFDQNPFNWALSAIEQSGELREPLSKNKVNLLGWQLMHAFRHQVPPELLIGFLYQTASSSPRKQKLIKDTGNIYREKWLDSYSQSLKVLYPPRLKRNLSA